MKNANVAPIASAKAFIATDAFSPSAAGANFAVAIEETGQAIYMALENVARDIECNCKGDEIKTALTEFLAGFDAAFYAASVKRKTSITLARTKATTLSAAVKLDIEASAKNLTKSTKSLYKAVLEIRLFKNGGTIDQNARDYKADHELSISGGDKGKKANKKKETGANGVINTAELCKTIGGFDMLLNAVIAGGVNSGNPEVIARAESIKAFLAGTAPAAKKPTAKKAHGLGDMLLAASA